MKVRDMVPAHVRELAAYQPGKPIEELERELGISGAIKIASNENPLGPSPKAVQAARRAMETAHYYPDGSCHTLRDALAERLGVDAAAVVIGAGANELIHLMVHAFCRPGIDEVLTHEYAFISYRLAAAGTDVPFVAAKVKDDLSCDVDALIAKMGDRTRLIFVANPNNPTGHHLSADEVRRIVDAKPPGAILILDEAYYEFARGQKGYESAFPSLRNSKGLVVLRTFSKAYGLAGLRVGWALMDPEVASYLHRLRRPFNVSSIAQAAALGALDDEYHVETSVETARHSIAELSAAATELGLRAYPSLANFVLVDVGRRSEEVYSQLLQSGVIVRPLAAWRLPNCVRISVGTREQTERAVTALRTVVS